jgi:hypothetical protein
MRKNASLVLAPHPTEGSDSWILFIPQRHAMNSISDTAQNCLKDVVLTELTNIPVSLQLLSKDPIHSSTPRKTLVQKVQQGEAPKGVLKRWPLYVIHPDHE